MSTRDQRSGWTHCNKTCVGMLAELLPVVKWRRPRLIERVLLPRICAKLVHELLDDCLGPAMAGENRRVVYLHVRLELTEKKVTDPNVGWNCVTQVLVDRGIGGIITSCIA